MFAEKFQLNWFENFFSFGFCAAHTSSGKKGICTCFAIEEILLDKISKVVICAGRIFWFEFVFIGDKLAVLNYAFHEFSTITLPVLKWAHFENLRRILCPELLNSDIKLSHSHQNQNISFWHLIKITNDFFHCLKIMRINHNIFENHIDEPTLYDLCAFASTM